MKKIKKIFLSLGLFIMLLGASMVVNAEDREANWENPENWIGWEQRDYGWKYQVFASDADKNYWGPSSLYIHNGVYQIDGTNYMFNNEGWLTSEWHYLNQGSWIYSPYGWWFDCGDGSYPANGIYEINGTAYAFDSQGYMVTGWYLTEYGFYYYFDGNSGAMHRGWLWDGAWYYLDPQFGDMYVNTIILDNGINYGVGASGALANGWFCSEYKYDGTMTWYYANPDGTLYTGWVWDNGYWYYLNNGFMCGQYNTGTTLWIDGKLYGFDEAGHMITGWWYGVTEHAPIESLRKWGWYYFNSDGSGANGWVWDNAWYYIENGIMVTGSKEIDGQMYEFGSNGVWIQ